VVPVNARTKDVLTIEAYSREELESIIEEARGFIPVARGEETSDIARGRILCTLFFEPSTRTRLSFESAMLRLGGTVLSFGDVSKTSRVKGETIADTIRMAAAYSDVVVIRSKFEGTAKLCSEFSDVPILNAGDGSSQHPTQTMLDLVTMSMECGGIDGKHVALVGDLKYGRTVHSLAMALALWDVKMTFISPPMLAMPNEVISYLKDRGRDITVTSDLASVVPDIDVLYMTRIQAERFPDKEEYQKVAGIYRVDRELLDGAREGLRVMHPLPRVNEISPEVDGTDHAIYFEQAFYGVPTRMALIRRALGK